VPQGYPPKKKKKEKRELSAALYDVQKASPDSRCDECIARKGVVVRRRTLLAVLSPHSVTLIHVVILNTICVI